LARHVLLEHCNGVIFKTFNEPLPLGRFPL
jgi:hypothetical protein